MTSTRIAKIVGICAGVGILAYLNSRATPTIQVVAAVLLVGILLVNPTMLQKICNAAAAGAFTKDASLAVVNSERPRVFDAPACRGWGVENNNTSVQDQPRILE